MSGSSQTIATRNVYLLPCRVFPVLFKSTIRPKAKLEAISYEVTNQKFIVNRCGHKPRIKLPNLTR